MALEMMGLNLEGLIHGALRSEIFIAIPANA
jgi:hypothetical protein